MGSALHGAASLSAWRVAAGASASSGLEAAPRAAAALLPQQRRTLVAAMDEIIPAAPGMPSASQAGCVEYLESVWQHEAGLRVELARSVDAAGAAARAAFGRELEALRPEERIDVLRAHEAADPSGFRILRDAVYEAYYTRLDVRRRLDRQLHPSERPGRRPPPFDEAILARVRRLPVLYRAPGR